MLIVLAIGRWIRICESLAVIGIIVTAFGIMLGMVKPSVAAKWIVGVVQAADKSGCA